MIRYIIITVSLMVLLFGCHAAEAAKKEEIPAYPAEIVMRYTEGAIPLVMALHLHDRQLPIPSYNINGALSPQTFDDILFPAQVWIIYTEPNFHVFLARSPKSGCTLQWHEEDEQFYDGCLGTIFSRDGQYLDGPPARALDELPVRIQDGMIWVSNQIIYGELPEEYAQ